MMRFGQFRRLRAVFLAFSLFLTSPGAHGELLVSPAGPADVKALAGSNVTLAVSFRGAPDPAVTWFLGHLPVVTWTIGSTAPPDIAEHKKTVLWLEQNGSLTFRNVSVGSTSNYTVEMTKSGLGTASTAFTLRVFEQFQNVVLSTQPSLAVEGSERLTLQYSMLHGVVEQQRWLYNGLEINKNNSHYSVGEQSLVILGPDRNDTGQYAVMLRNPFSNVTAHRDIIVLYGPDEPVLGVQPSQSFHVSGDSLRLSCQAEGFPRPAAQWEFGGEAVSDSGGGELDITNVKTSQGGVYTCTLLNEETKNQRSKSILINVYEKPSGNPTCSVQAENSAELQYTCQWLGGVPLAHLSFPALSNTSSGAGNFSLTVNATNNLDGKTVTCTADHPVEQNKCNITASSPAAFLPAMGTTVDSKGKIVVTIYCVSEASPKAVVSWSKGGEPVITGATYHISSNTTQLTRRDYNISSFLLHTYTCVCRNPLGSQRRDIQLRGPSISDSSLFPNRDGTVVTLTWEVSPMSVVTGFEIQMKGPDLLSGNQTVPPGRGSASKFRTIKQKGGSERSADIFFLDPKSTYRFRVVPKARMSEGEPSEVHRIGPGDGLSGPAIAGIAAGIPCSLLFLLLLCGLIFLGFHCKNKRRQTGYPVVRAADKAMTTETDKTPHYQRPGGLKSVSDYNGLQKTSSETSVAVPTFVPPVPVRVATIV